jgi:probable rRNA maturation factor
MSTAITVTNESGMPCDTERLERLAAFLLGRLRIHPASELSVVAVTEERMSELHVTWMDEPGPTDVLSFPMDELRSAEEHQEPQPGMLGDVVLCPSYAAQQAASAGRSLEEELEFLLTHGILHLIGYDHQSPEDYQEMFAMQDSLLAAWSEVS